MEVISLKLHNSFEVAVDSKTNQSNSPEKAFLNNLNAVISMLHALVAQETVLNRI